MRCSISMIMLDGTGSPMEMTMSSMTSVSVLREWPPWTTGVPAFMRGKTEQYANVIPTAQRTKLSDLLEALEHTEATSRQKSATETYREYSKWIDTRLRKALSGQEEAIELLLNPPSGTLTPRLSKWQSSRQSLMRWWFMGWSAFSLSGYTCK